MTYARRTFRRPKDYLLLTLKHLFQGEEIICTDKTFDNIKGRLNEFTKSRQDRRMAIIHDGRIRKIRRVV